MVKADGYRHWYRGRRPDALHNAVRARIFVALPSEGATLRTYAPDARIFVLRDLDGMEPFFFDHDLVR